ncbi:unnamed protein product [Musa hybrid cultivar]
MIRSIKIVCYQRQHPSRSATTPSPSPSAPSSSSLAHPVGLHRPLHFPSPWTRSLPTSASPFRSRLLVLCPTSEPWWGIFPADRLRRTSGAKERSRSDLFSGSRQDLIMMKLSEIVPKNLRGALGSVDQLSVTIDLFLAYLMGMFVRWRLLKVKGNSFELS